MTIEEFDQETARLVAYFSIAELPKGKVQFNKWSCTDDLTFTVESHFKKLNGGIVFAGSIIELQEIEKYLAAKI